MARTKKKMRTRSVAILVGIGVAVAGGGLAFAYFTNIGSGSGGATTGSNNPVVVNQTGPSITGMAPGVPAVQLLGDFNNPNPGGVFIKSVTATVSIPGPTPAANPALPGCTASDYVIGVGGAAGTTQTGTTLDVRTAVGGAVGTGAGVEVPAGNAKGYWGGLTLQFKNTNANQDNCKNVPVTITYTAA